jgi:hypothetical protein
MRRKRKQNETRKEKRDCEKEQKNKRGTYWHNFLGRIIER